MDAPLLVSPQWLHDNLDNPQVRVIESAWVAEAYPKAHIPGALRQPCHPHLKIFTAAGDRTPHVLDAGSFYRLCQQLGLRRERHYVLYDDFYGLFAARFWWVCRYFGVPNVSVLDGSWRGWLAQGRPVSSHIETPEPGSDIEASPCPELLIRQPELQRRLDDAELQLWDTRRASEYDGTEETDNLRRGHIPGALNLVWTDLLREADGEGGARFLLSREQLEGRLSELGLHPDKTIITYCQSGIRAAFALLVLELLGYPRTRLYDGSMFEWANLADAPLNGGPGAG